MSDFSNTNRTLSLSLIDLRSDAFSAESVPASIKCAIDVINFTNSAGHQVLDMLWILIGWIEAYLQMLILHHHNFILFGIEFVNVQLVSMKIEFRTTIFFVEF